MDRPINPRAFAPSIISLPSYVLDDEEIRGLIARLYEIQDESGKCLRAQDAINELKAELFKRGVE